MLIKYDDFINKIVLEYYNNICKDNVLDIDKYLELDEVIQEKIICLLLENIYSDDLMLINDRHVNLINNLIHSNKKNSYIYLPNNVKKIIKSRNIKFYTINAEDIALNAGIKGKISKIMEMVMLHLLEYPNALETLNHSIEKQFEAKGDEIINANKKAITEALSNLKLNTEDLKLDQDEEDKDENIFDIINARKGDSLPVSELVPFRDGTFPCGLSKNEKRKVSTYVPKWDSSKCIQCGQCAIVCPHAVIRPFAVTDKNVGIPMLGKPEYNFVIEVSEADCTSCGLCINACTGKGGEKDAITAGNKVNFSIPVSFAVAF
jgi:pyruvate-ferredoxin/flavodoxin oxidoreductase